MNSYNHSYYLEKYTGRGSRHECPRCGDPHSFVYYIDGDTGRPIDKTVGRCNHEHSCSYHCTPREYFVDNPRERERAVVPAQSSPARPRQEQELSYIPWEYVRKSASYKSDFVYFLCGLFDRYTLASPTIERLMQDYALGATKDGSVIFWQIDTKGKVRTGKIMRYDPDTGHRIKSGGGINWIHAILKRRGVFPAGFNLSQCLFGEYLLKVYPERTVALVEAEKTAVICAGVFPQYVWLAAGGKSQLSTDKLKVLQGRTVIMFPDAGCFEDWSRKAREIEATGCRIVVSDLLEKNATDEERTKGIDIADWIIAQLRHNWAEAGKKLSEIKEELSEAEKTLRGMIEVNPAVQTLIDTFNLKLIA